MSHVMREMDGGPRCWPQLGATFMDPFFQGSSNFIWTDFSKSKGQQETVFIDPFFQVISNFARTDFSECNDPEVKLLRSTFADSLLPSACTERNGNPGMFLPRAAIGPTDMGYMLERAEDYYPQPKRRKRESRVAPPLKKHSSSNSEDAWTRSCLAVIGESRLKICFENIGKLGAPPQRFGKSGLLVADGLSGTHEMYKQPWKFQVTQGPTVDDEVAVLTWTITNLSSGKSTSVTETPKQATFVNTVAERYATEFLGMR